MAMALNPSTAPAKEEVSSSSPAAPKPSPSPKSSPVPKDEILAVARKFSDDPLQNPDPTVWAVLTAISTNARRRRPESNILLRKDEHSLGRCVQDTRFQIADIAVSSKHCKIFRESAVTADGEMDINLNHAFLKDTSTNGTYLNWERLRKSTLKARLQHGDIISFVAPPHDVKAYAFVYREVHKSIGFTNGAVTSTKRKADEFVAESKRLKGIGIGAPDGPISLDDVRSLQRSNTELRQQLESHVITIETLRKENRESITRHENDLKELNETVSKAYLDQIKELQHALDVKQKEQDELNTLSSELGSTIKDLNERLDASVQSRVDADEIINSQKATISDLEAQLDEERNQRKVERENAEANLKAAIGRAHSESQAEIKRQADVHLRQHKEQQEVISKLQESEKESRSFVEALRSKLEDARESLVKSEKKVRQLEVQLQDEQTASSNSRKKCDVLESELKRLRKELEGEKVAREEAWAKVSVLEFEIAAALRDLSMERQRFQGARERIILRETQLRAFYSTTEEISALFTKQQEQLKAMQKTLEDEENCDTSLGIDLNGPAGKTNVIYANAREVANLNSNRTEASGASTPKNVQAVDVSSGNDDDGVSTTEKHDCEMRNLDENTQDLECTSADRLVKGFVSDLDGVGTAVVPNLEPTDTEQVIGTESQVGDGGLDEQNAALHQSNNQTGETMQLDVETQAQENIELTERPEDRVDPCSQSRIEDTQTCTIRTGDLLASEVAGSWAISTAPSAHGENESPRSNADAGAGDEDVAAAALVLCSEGEGQAVESQNNATWGIKMSREHQALNAMIDIVAPEFKQQFQGRSGSKEGKNDSMSDAETEEGSNPRDASDDDDDDGETGTDDDANANEVGNDAMIEDSVG